MTIFIFNARNITTVDDWQNYSQKSLSAGMTDVVLTVLCYFLLSQCKIVAVLKCTHGS